MRMIALAVALTATVLAAAGGPPIERAAVIAARHQPWQTARTDPLAREESGEARIRTGDSGAPTRGTTSASQAPAAMIDDRADDDAAPPAPKPRISLGALDIWDTGLCEMSFYRAVDVIYGKPRHYTRVHLLNRQWMDGESGVKAERDAPGAIPVFKLNIAEEIPTENYNYRYLTTVFVDRIELKPMKMIVSSQEWCGATFKHLRWRDNTLMVRSFSYFPDEGDRSWAVPHPSQTVLPFESLFIIARDAAASQLPRSIQVLPPMRSNHDVQPGVIDARLELAAAGTATVPAGTFAATRVTLHWDGPETIFVVESAPPYRLLSYKVGDLSGRLIGTERRAYWNPSSPSSFHAPLEAP